MYLSLLSPCKSDLWTLSLLERIAETSVSTQSSPWNQISLKVNSLKTLFNDIAFSYRQLFLVKEFVLTLWKCLFAGNHYERKRTGRVAGNMPWASATRRPWVRTTLWYRLSPGRRRKRYRHYRLSHFTPNMTIPFHPERNRVLPEVFK